MFIVLIIVVMVVGIVLLGLAGSFMARAETSANLAQFANAGRMLRGVKAPKWIKDGLRGELGERRDDESD
jgi:hypothetical protein